MREFIVGKNDAGQRLDRWLGKTLPLLPVPLAQKYIRLKRVKVNGKGAQRDYRLTKGDLLQLYINDEFFDRPREDNAFLSVFKPVLDIVYEDENIIICNKRPGLLCHPDAQEYVNTLITHIQAYLYQKKEWDPKDEASFTPALCHRIDRNTGGLVIAAKTAEALRVMNQKIKDREIEKYYLCLVSGVLSPKEGLLEDYLWKDEDKKQVFLRDHPVPGGKTAQTEYRTLAVKTTSPWWSVTCSPDAPTRSAPRWPTQGIPYWETANTAMEGSTGAMAAPSKLSGPIGWNLPLPRMPALWVISGTRPLRSPEIKSIFWRRK